MKERILVTGGAGYLGSILVPELLAAGYHVTVLDNFLYRENSLAASCASENFAILNGDVRNESLIAELAPRFDTFIPLAALVGAPLCARDPHGAEAINRDSPLFLFRRLSASQRVLMPTTNSAYGTWDGRNACDERSPLRPLSLYSRHKVEVEQALMSHPNAISFRLATVFGMSPRMRLDLLVNDFVYRAVTDRAIVLFEPHFKRNYLHVRDVAGVFLFGLANHERMRGEIFNVGLDDANLTKRELCEAIRREVGEFSIHEAETGQDPDKRNYVVSNEKILATGFRPHHSLSAGIRELVKGYAMLRNSRYVNC